MAERLTLDQAQEIVGTRNRLPISQPYYNRRGDFLAVYFSDETSYSERMDDVVTVYKSSESHRLTGCKIKGVSLLAQNVATMLKLCDGEIEVRMMLLNALGQRKPHQYIYDLRDLLGEIKVPAKQILQRC